MGKHRVRSRRAAFVVAAFVLSACGGRQAPSPTVPVAHGPAAPVAFDTSPMEPPANLVGTIRVGPLRPFLVRLDSLFGSRGIVTSNGLAAYGALLGSARTPLVDPDGPVDGAGVHLEGDIDETKWVFAFPTRDVAATCESALENGLSCERASDGSFLVRATRDTDEGPRFCTLYPTAAGTGRLVCGDETAAIDSAGPYLARTLARDQAPDFSIVGDLSVATVRARYGRRAAEQVEVARTRFDARVAEVTQGPRSHPEVKEQLIAIGNRLFDEAAKLVDEIDAIGFVVRADETNLHFTYRAHVVNPSGELVRAYRDSARATAMVPPELVARLPAGGYFYGVRDADPRGFQPIADSLVELARRIVAAEGSASPADVTALDSALRAVAKLRMGAAAIGLGYDAQGRTRSVSVRRYESEADVLEALAAAKSLLSALKAPSIATALEHLTTAEEDRSAALHFRELRELPARGLPRGAFGMRVPRLDLVLRALGVDETTTTLIAGTTAAPRARGAAADTMEILYVPSGRDLIVVQASDARATYQAIERARTEPLDPASLSSESATFAGVIFPGELRIPAMDGTGTSSPLRERLGSDAAHARIDVRLHGVEHGGNATLGVEAIFDPAALRAFAPALEPFFLGGMASQP